MLFEAEEPDGRRLSFITIHPWPGVVKVVPGARDVATDLVWGSSDTQSEIVVTEANTRSSAGERNGDGTMPLSAWSFTHPSLLELNNTSQWHIITMTKIEIDTSDLNICLATLSVYICIYGLVSYVIKHRLYLSEPLIASLFGIIVGPAVLGWVDPNLWKPEEDRLMGYKDSLTLALTRITIGIQVFLPAWLFPKNTSSYSSKVS
ncbi:hypothetical protein OPQ81_005915 [Rhizoctonia solani]|nr:hypothetical protein OPQ81_005915 [Rhizoctonia solani]